MQYEIGQKITIRKYGREFVGTVTKVDHNSTKMPYLVSIANSQYWPDVDTIVEDAATSNRDRLIRIESKLDLILNHMGLADTV